MSRVKRIARTLITLAIAVGAIASPWNVARAEEGSLDDLPDHVLKDIQDYERHDSETREALQRSPSSRLHHIVARTLTWNPNAALHWWAPVVTPSGRVRLRVAFLGGLPRVHRLIEETAVDWAKYAHVEFDFRNANGQFRQWSRSDGQVNAEIRISFVALDERGQRRTWSNYGQLSAWHADEASMNFDELGVSGSDLDKLIANWQGHRLRRTVLHEFGHALGFVHEHFHRQCQIGFNWQKLSATVPPIGHNETRIRTQYKGQVKLKSGQWIALASYWPLDQSAQPDKYSVMMYQYPPEYYNAFDCYLANPPATLSVGDQTTAREAYPRIDVSTPVVDSAPSPQPPPFARPEAEHACSNYREGWALDDYIKFCTRMIDIKESLHPRQFQAALVDRAYFYRERFLHGTEKSREARLAAVLREGDAARPLAERDCRAGSEIDDLNKAKKDLDDAIAGAPGYALAWSNRASVYMIRRCKGDLTLALKDYDAAEIISLLSPHHISVAKPLGAENGTAGAFAFLAKCDPDKAIEWFTKVIADNAERKPADPGLNARAYYGLGLARKLRCNIKSDSVKLADKVEGERLMRTALGWSATVRADILREYAVDDSVLACKPAGR